MITVFGRNKHLIQKVTVGAHTRSACDSVSLLGLRIDNNLSYTSHVNYVISRINQVKVMLIRLSHLFDRYTRLYLVKALLLPIINLYDFIYDSAKLTNLHALDVAYNNIIRVILGIRKSAHFRVADLHTLTNQDKLSDRRQKSLLKFMHNIVEGKTHSRLRQFCVKGIRTHVTRSRGYTIPRFKTNIGRQRIVVRGLKLLNVDNDVSCL